MIHVGSFQGPSVRCDIPAALRKVDEILAEAATAGLDIVQFPELYLCGYDIQPDETAKYAVSLSGGEIGTLKELAAKHRVAVGIGYAEVEGGAVYNSCCVLDAAGKVTLNYRKTHLWDPTMEGEKLVFRPGGNLPVAELHLPRSGISITVGVLICFDCEFPEPARVLALNGAQVILISTAICDDATPRLMIPCRAAENHVAIVYSNLMGRNCTFPAKVWFCGQSAIIAPNGDELARAARTESGLISATVDRSRYTEHKMRNDYIAERRPELYSIMNNI
ncbi:unnamed protein product [Ectocarpus fasciculatus]